MGRQWATLILVVVGAAIAGWATVHLLDRGAPPVQVAVEPAAVATVAAPEPTVGAVATKARPIPTPVGPVPTVEEPPPAEGDESGVIVRDLEVLAQALVRDQRIEDNVMPRVNDILDIPGATAYRRVPDFWEPVLGKDEESEQ